jgi:hypothetical protein
MESSELRHLTSLQDDSLFVGEQTERTHTGPFITNDGRDYNRRVKPVSFTDEDQRIKQMN